MGSGLGRSLPDTSQPLGAHDSSTVLCEVFCKCGGLLLLRGFFFLPPSSPRFFHPFNPLTLDKREKRVEGKGKTSLNKVRGWKAGDAAD